MTFARLFASSRSAFIAHIFMTPLLLCVFCSALEAQVTPTLSVQGILKKANGASVDDGSYNMTFKLYATETGGTALWTDTQSGVEVSNGIYSTVLGNGTALTLPFDQLYYLGVSVGSTELTPRILLTSAPYALALIGQSNKFPSSGVVVADSMRVKGGVLARGGAPGLNGASKNGYAFTGNSGDKDSGLFSTGDGKVSLYADNTEVLAVTPTGVQSNTNLTVAGTVVTNNVTLNNNGNIAYGSVGNGWRLVSEDYFENGADGWLFSQDDNDDRGAWKNGTSGACPTADFGDFAGKVLRPADNDYVVKKQFSPSGTYSQVKVIFKYFALGNWDPGDLSSRGFAAFANDQFGSNIRIAWTCREVDMGQIYLFDYDQFRSAASIVAPNNSADNWTTGTMIAARSTPFWVYFGYGNNENPTDENFAIGAVEVWVK